MTEYKPEVTTKISSLIQNTEILMFSHSNFSAFVLLVTFYISLIIPLSTTIYTLNSLIL